ncbi:MAG: hypothetical protein PHV34_08915 [Verrucomicrobiae bacterium]|nr:hypothetical protein [Verrucomicrobiae bacterium]
MSNARWIIEEVVDVQREADAVRDRLHSAVSKWVLGRGYDDAGVGEMLNAAMAPCGIRFERADAPDSVPPDERDVSLLGAATDPATGWITVYHLPGFCRNFTGERMRLGQFFCVVGQHLDRELAYCERLTLPLSSPHQGPNPVPGAPLRTTFWPSPDQQP